MEAISYLLKVNLIFALMFAAFALFMQRTAFHHLNRWYLLLAPVLALLLPWYGNTSVSKAIYIVQLPEVSAAYANATPTTEGFPFEVLPIAVWAIGALWVGTRTVLQLVQARKALRSGLEMPFTFMGKVHLPTGDQKHAANIAAHEQVHADQWHSLDLLWYALLRVVFWINPLFKAGSVSLKRLHEYIADEHANRTTENYPETLVANAFGLSVLPLANEFKSVNIKQRVSMLKKKRNNRQGMALGLSILMVAVAALTISWTAVVLPSEISQDKVYEKVDQMPLYPGCDASKVKPEDMKACAFKLMAEFMGREVKYPKAAEKAGTQGTVKVKFIVTTDGSLKKVHVIGKVSEELDAEAVRVVRAMPNWVPGMHEGKKVNVAMVLPIKFAL